MNNLTLGTIHVDKKGTKKLEIKSPQLKQSIIDCVNVIFDRISPIVEDDIPDNKRFRMWRMMKAEAIMESRPNDLTIMSRLVY